MDRKSEGFDMDTGRCLGRGQKGATKVLQNLGPKEKGDYGQFYAESTQLEGTQKSQAEDPGNYLNIEKEAKI